MPIDDLDTPCSPDASEIIRLTDVKGALIRGCRPKAGTNLFLNLQGPHSERVVLMANDLSTVLSGACPACPEHVEGSLPVLSFVEVSKDKFKLSFRRFI